MANISDIIEQFIVKTLGDDEFIDISRNELANFFSCVPSQINYVLETRFTVDRGYTKDSRRGGGGYIRISKIPVENDAYINSLILESIGNELSYNRAVQILAKLQDENIITNREKKIITSAITAKTLNLPINYEDKLRAIIFKEVLIVLLKEKNA